MHHDHHAAPYESTQLSLKDGLVVACHFVSLSSRSQSSKSSRPLSMRKANAPPVHYGEPVRVAILVQLVIAVDVAVRVFGFLHNGSLSGGRAASA